MIDLSFTFWSGESNGSNLYVIGPCIDLSSISTGPDCLVKDPLILTPPGTELYTPPPLLQEVKFDCSCRPSLIHTEFECSIPSSLYGYYSETLSFEFRSIWTDNVTSRYGESFEISLTNPIEFSISFTQGESFRSDFLMPLVPRFLHGEELETGVSATSGILSSFGFGETLRTHVSSSHDILSSFSHGESLESQIVRQHDNLTAEFVYGESSVAEIVKIAELDANNKFGEALELKVSTLADLSVNFEDGSFFTSEPIPVYLGETLSYYGDKLESRIVQWFEFDILEFYGEGYRQSTLIPNYSVFFGEDSDYNPNTPQVYPCSPTTPEFIKLSCTRIVPHHFSSTGGNSSSFSLDTITGIPAKMFCGENCGFGIELPRRENIQHRSADGSSLGSALSTHTLIKSTFGNPGSHLASDLTVSPSEGIGEFNAYHGQYYKPHVLTEYFIPLIEKGSSTNFVGGESFGNYTIRTLPGLYKFQKFEGTVLGNEYVYPDGNKQAIAQEFKPFSHRVMYCHLTLHEFKYRVIEGELPLGLEMDETGCISGVIGDLDAMNCTAEFGPSHNWFGQDYHGEYVPYEFVFRFKVGSYDKFSGKILDTKWCQIRVLNNWDKDLEEFEKKMLGPEVKFIEDPKIVQAVTPITDPIREVKLCGCSDPVVTGTQAQPEVEQKAPYIPAQMSDSINKRRHELNNTLPLESLFFHSDNMELDLS